MPRYSGAVVVRGDKVRQVKNLGWLLAHWQDVERFEILTDSPPGPLDGAYLIAHLRDGGRYETSFASRSVLKNWLKRPVFDGVPVHYPDLARAMASAHGLCERAGYCVEHEQNPKIEACK